MISRIHRTRLPDGQYESRINIGRESYWAIGHTEKVADAGLIFHLAEILESKPLRVNDYTCPFCKGTGRQSDFTSMYQPYDCGFCGGSGRLPDRRAKTLSDRRQNVRRNNSRFPDRRKSI